jgi:hypothetical protein
MSDRQHSYDARKMSERRLTAAADRATGKFYCSSSAHRATGPYVLVNGRKVCQACADKRRRVLMEKANG